MEYCHDYMAVTIRCGKVKEALQFLVNNPLYREHNVHINDNSGFNNKEIPFVAYAEDVNWFNLFIRKISSITIAFA